MNATEWVEIYAGHPPKSPVVVLREAKAFLAKPEAWTQGDFAKDAKGNVVPTRSDAAKAWCISGAMYRIAGTADLDAPHIVAMADAVGVESGHVCTWNDEPGRTHEEVLAAFDRAIAIAEASV